MPDSHQGGVPDGRQWDKVDPVLKVLEQVCGHLQAQAGLAGATRTGEGQQTHVRTPQERTGYGAYPLTSDERGGLHGQVVGATVEALERREVSRQV